MEKAYGKAAPGVNTARDALFRPDNTHPVEEGYDFYTKAIINELSDESFRKPEGEPMNEHFCKKCGKFISAREFARTGEWSPYGTVGWSVPNPGRSGTGLASSDKAATLALEFYGRSILLGARFDRNAGKAELTLDGESRVCDLCYATDDQPVIILAEHTLPEGKHTLCVHPAEGNVKIDFAVIPE